MCTSPPVSMLGACAAEINLLRKRRIGPYSCDFSANRTTMHLKIVKIWPRFSTFSLRSFLPRRLLARRNPGEQDHVAVRLSHGEHLDPVLPLQQGRFGNDCLETPAAPRSVEGGSNRPDSPVDGYRHIFHVPRRDSSFDGSRNDENEDGIGRFQGFQVCRPAEKRPEVETLVEIYQGLRDTYEHAGAPQPGTLKSQDAKDRPGYVWNALARGTGWDSSPPCSPES